MFGHFTTSCMKGLDSVVPSASWKTQKMLIDTMQINKAHTNIHRQIQRDIQREKNIILNRVSKDENVFL